MSELHSLLVIDSETGRVISVTGLEEAPVDSKGVWDTDREVWRYPTDEELAMQLDVEAKVRGAIEAAGLA